MGVRLKWQEGCRWDGKLEVSRRRGWWAWVDFSRVRGERQEQGERRRSRERISREYFRN